MQKRKRDFVLFSMAILLIMVMVWAITHQSLWGEIRPYTASLERMIRIRWIVSLIVLTAISIITLFWIPVKLARINRAAYFKETLFCAFASLVYFGVDRFMNYLDQAYTMIYMLVNYLASSIIISLVLLYISRTVSDKSGKYRTALAGSIAGGILFGLLLEFIKRSRLFFM